MTTRFSGALLVAVAACFLATDSDAQPSRVERFGLTWTSEGGWGKYCRLEVTGSRRGAGSTRLLCHTPPRSLVEGGRIVINTDSKASLPASDVERFVELIGRADLFGGRHTGIDPRGGDGLFETLQVWVNAPTRTAVLVTSGNGSFNGGDEARTFLLQELQCLEERLRNQGKPKPVESSRCPGGRPSKRQE